MEPLKNILNESAVRWLADSLGSASASFDKERFAAACLDGLESLELKQRAAHIAGAMGRFLPHPFPAAARIVSASLGPEIAPTGETGVAVLRYLPLDNFIERFGLDHPEDAFALQEEVTKRCSCEFSIRAFILRHPEKTYRQLLKWTASGNAHLRRLASEGSRPRLPWAQRLPAFQADPAPVIAILERLKNDPVRYVQRSVANSINDISKDNPDVATELCARWMRDADAGRTWIVRHALRDLVKKGHPAALGILGSDKPPQVRLENISLSPPRLAIGERFRFSLDLVSTANDRQDLIADFAIHYVKARGGTSPKVFKLSRLSLEPGQRVTLRSSVSFADMTTRRHYPGPHRLALQINGTTFDMADFELHGA